MSYYDNQEDSKSKGTIDMTEVITIQAQMTPGGVAVVSMVPIVCCAHVHAHVAFCYCMGHMDHMGHRPVASTATSVNTKLEGV